MDGTIRTARPPDAAAIAAIYAPIVRDTHTSFETVPPTPDEMGARVSTALERYPWLVYEREGAVVGYAYAGAHRSRHAYQWAVETSAYVAEGARRSGVGRDLMAALLDTLTRQRFTLALAGISLPNEASVRFHESLGFERTATYPRVGYKQGRWYDTAWWQLALVSGGGAPADPIWFPDLTPRASRGTPGPSR